MNSIEHGSFFYVSLGALLIGSILVLGVLVFARFTPVVSESIDYVEGTVVSHAEGRTGNRGANPYFIVKLQNGTTVRASDFGGYSTNYRGKVTLIKGKSSLTGVATYRVKIP